MHNSTSTIYIACPWSPVGGGMFKVADYLNQSQLPEQTPLAQRARLAALDTRGGGSAVASAFVLAKALGRMLVGRVRGDLRGVHVNMAERLSLFRKCAVVLWARALGVPVVLHLHAAQLHHFYASLPSPVQAFVRWTFAKATCCVVLGKASQEFVVGTLKVPAQRVEIINNGVPEPTVARQPLSAQGGKRRMFFLGNLSERKGVSDLLKALAQSQLAQAGQIEAVFAGGGDIEGYSAKARELGIDGFTRFVGWCDQQQAATWMASSDALVLPSYDEGLPLVILEALANSVAVICTPVGEIHHNLVDGKEAHFVKPGDVQALAYGLDRVLGDADFRHLLEREGRALFDRGFSLDQFADSVARVHLSSFGVAARPVTLQ
jgi:glycosyltransferase involved in cell wall biosynthesis